MQQKSISVITPIYFPKLQELEECLKSAAISPDVEHVLVLDGSNSCEEINNLKDLVNRYGAQLFVNEQKGGISEALNRAATEARNTFLLLLDQDDFLLDGWFEEWPENQSEYDIIYSDRTASDSSGRLLQTEIFRKPDWSPVRLLGNMYLSHFFAVSRKKFFDVGGFRSEYDGSQDHDLALRLLATQPRVFHIAKVLYAWRQSETSTSLNPRAKNYAIVAGENCVNDYFNKCKINAKAIAIAQFPGFIEVSPAERDSQISVVIPTAFATKSGTEPIIVECLKALGKQLKFDDELIIVVDESGTTQDFTQLQNLVPCPLRIIVDTSEFNYSKRVNLGAIAASKEFLLFMNDDVVVTSQNALTKAAFYAEMQGIGAVGIKLKFPDGKIQHVGHSYHLLAAHHPYYLESCETQNFGDNIIDREVSGVTAAFLMQRRVIWQEVGGFTLDLPNNYNDVDFCLKIRNKGLSIISMNSVSGIHYESISRNPKLERFELDFIRNRWSHRIWKDRFTRISEWHSF